MEALGRHILVEFFLCNPEALNDVALIESAMVNAATESNATVINSNFHHFSPWGVSGVVVIQESHLAIHTWPEYQYAAADLFTCGDSVNPWVAFDYLKEAFQSQNQSALELHRGAINLLERIPFNADNARKIAEDRMMQTEAQRSIWMTDKDENTALSLRTSGKPLFDKTSPYQRVRIYDTYGYGKALYIDNMMMCTEKDEAHYHEMIAHPAMFAHSGVKDVLVIGGGDGGTVREVLRHDSVEKVVMVEIDSVVVEASKKHLPALSSAFNHPRLKLYIGDGIQYVKDAPAESFDLILVDGSDPVGPAEGLFTESFYKDCSRVLRKNGILVSQGESPAFNSRVFVQLNQCLKNVFGKDRVNVALFQIATYPSGVWSFQIASKQPIDLLDVDKKRIQDFVKAQNLSYYNDKIHKAGFALPNNVIRMLEGGE